MASPAYPAAAERLSFNLNVAVEKFSGGSKENPETFLRTIESAKSLYNSGHSPCHLGRQTCWVAAVQLAQPVQSTQHSAAWSNGQQ